MSYIFSISENPAQKLQSTFLANAISLKVQNSLVFALLYLMGGPFTFLVQDLAARV